MRLREDGLEKASPRADVDRRDRPRRRHPSRAGPHYSRAAVPADARDGMNFDFADILLKVVEHKASDLPHHLGRSPTIRVRGSLVPSRACRT